MAILVETGSRQIIPINKNKFIIGRCKTANLRIQATHFSIKQSLLRKIGPNWWIRNLSKCSKTYINGEKVNGMIQLHSGDVLSFQTHYRCYEFYREEMHRYPTVNTGHRVQQQNLCVICTDIMHLATTLNCSHTFCYSCVTRWKRTKNTCPLCRKRILSLRLYRSI